MKKTAATAVAVIGLGALASQSFASPGTTASASMGSSANARCRTIRDKGSDTGNPLKTVTAHACDKIIISFVFGTQGQIVPSYSIHKKPSAKILKIGREGVSAIDAETAFANFHFRAVGVGRTKVTFQETTASERTPLGSETIKITVLPERPLV